MTPFPRAPWAPRAHRASSGRLDSMRRRVQIDTFARNWASNFRQIGENRLSTSRHPKAPPKGPPREPRAHGAPKGSKGRPKAPQRSPRASQGSARGSKRSLWAPQGSPRASQREPEGAKESPSTPKYIKKLPINFTSGRYVIVNFYMEGFVKLLIIHLL